MPISDKAIAVIQDDITAKCERKADEQFKIKIIRKVKEWELADTKDELLEKTYGEEFGKWVKRYRDCEDKLAADKIPTKDITWAWVTINPHTDDLNTLQDTVDRILSKKWLLECVYQYEQRSTDAGSPSGYHVHMMIRKPQGKRPSEIKREIISTAKRICKEPFNRTIKIEFKTEQTWEDYIQYLSGQKQEKKRKACEVNLLWRQQNDLQIYPYVYNAFEDN